MRLRDAGAVLLVTLAAAFFLKTVVLEAFRISSASMEDTLLVGDYLVVNKLAYGIRTPLFRLTPALTIPSFRVPLFRPVRRGEIIVFDFPGERNGARPARPPKFIKRCVGIPGDTVEIRAGRVYVNGSPLTEPPHAHAEPGANERNVQGPLSGSGDPIPAAEYGPVIVPSAGTRLSIDAGSTQTWRTLIAREGHALQTTGDGDVLIDGHPVSEYIVEQDHYFVLGDNRENSFDSREWGFVPETSIIGEAIAIYWSWDPAAPGGRLASVRWNRVGMLVR